MNTFTTITNKVSKKDRIKELIKYKEIIYFLSWKEFVVRYKQTALGTMWAIIQPIFSMIVMSFIFGGLAKMPSDGIPYPILVYSALLPWNFFTSAFNGTSNSLVNNAHMLKKIYFPRLTLPISSVMTSFVDFIISFGVLVIIMIIFRYIPPIRIVLMPIFVLLAFIIALGSGLFFATMNVKYRDIKYLVPVILQFGMYLSPVGYSSEVVPQGLKLLYSLNPMVGIIEGFRWCITPNSQIYIPALIISVIFSIVFLILGIRFFTKFEDTFADLI